MLNLLGLGIAKEIPPRDPDVIVPLGYSMDSRGLSKATKNGIHRALVCGRKFNHALVCMANDDICTVGTEGEQRRLKLEFVRDQHFDETRVISVGPIQNTVTELTMVKAALAERSVTPREVLLICNRHHGASALLIAYGLWSGVRISLKYSSGNVSQPDHELFLLRREWTWIVSNWIRYAALRILGLERVKKISQPKMKLKLA